MVVKFRVDGSVVGFQQMSLKVTIMFKMTVQYTQLCVANSVSYLMYVTKLVRLTMFV